jgi:hypothetical protein
MSNRSKGCSCECHRGGRIQHVIPCCERATRVETFLRTVVEASIDDALKLSDLEREAEREKQRQAALEDRIEKTVGGGSSKSHKNEDDPIVGGAPKRDALAGSTGSEAPAQSEPEEPAGEIDAEAIIDKFNIIRSGRSMNDRDISTAIQKFMGTLKPEQRKAVFQVLAQIGKIVQPNVDTTRLTKPPEEPSAVQAARVQMLQKRREDREDAAQRHTAAQDAPQRSAPKPTATPRADEPKENDEEKDKEAPPIRVGRRNPV